MRPPTQVGSFTAPELTGSRSDSSPFCTPGSSAPNAPRRPSAAAPELQLLRHTPQFRRGARGGLKRYSRSRRLKASDRRWSNAVTNTPRSGAGEVARHPSPRYSASDARTTLKREFSPTSAAGAAFACPRQVDAGCRQQPGNARAAVVGDASEACVPRRTRGPAGPAVCSVVACRAHRVSPWGSRQRSHGESPPGRGPAAALAT